MEVTLKNYTPNPEDFCVYVARVSSNKSEEEKRQNTSRLINYLITNQHWSPFEHAFFTFEIKTSKAIGIQLLRHRSFTFQEFSQRYSEVTEIEPVEIRQQADKNRQSSTEIFDPVIASEAWSLKLKASELIEDVIKYSNEAYQDLLKAGVAKECARMILPMTSSTTIYMTGSIRSWIHFLKIRDDEHAQKEIQEIAREIKKQLIFHLPNISTALGWV